MSDAPNVFGFVDFFGDEDWLLSETRSESSYSCESPSVFDFVSDDDEPSSDAGSCSAAAAAADAKVEQPVKRRRRGSKSKSKSKPRCKVVVDREVQHGDAVNGDNAAKPGPGTGTQEATADAAGGAVGGSAGPSLSSTDSSAATAAAAAAAARAAEDAVLKQQFHRASFLLNNILMLYNSGDGDALADFYKENSTPGFEYHEMAEDPENEAAQFARGLVGIDAYGDLIRNLFKGAPDAVLTLSQMTLREKGQLIVCKCTVAGTMLAPVEFPGTERPAEMSAAAKEAVADVDAPVAEVAAADDVSDSPLDAHAPVVRYRANGTLAYTLEPVTGKIARLDSRFHAPTTELVSYLQTCYVGQTKAGAAAVSPTTRQGSGSGSGSGP